MAPMAKLKYAPFSTSEILDIGRISAKDKQ